MIGRDDVDMGWVTTLHLEAGAMTPKWAYYVIIVDRLNHLAGKSGYATAIHVVSVVHLAVCHSLHTRS